MCAACWTGVFSVPRVGFRCETLRRGKVTRSETSPSGGSFAMNTSIFRWTAVFLAFLIGAGAMRSSLPRVPSQVAGQTPSLTNTCLITNDVKRLAEFYERALQVKAHASGDSYVEFPTGAGTLAIFAADAQDKYIPGAAQAGQNRSAILEFHVADVDREYARLQGIVNVWVKPPTTQPWGTRSIYFRDPDGNLVDFFNRVKP